MIVSLETLFNVQSTEEDSLLIQFDAVQPQMFAETPVPVKVAFFASPTLEGQWFNCRYSGTVLITNVEPNRLGSDLVTFQEVDEGVFVSFAPPPRVNKAFLTRTLSESGEGAFFLLLAPPAIFEETLSKPWKAEGAFLTQS